MQLVVPDDSTKGHLVCFKIGTRKLQKYMKIIKSLLFTIGLFSLTAQAATARDILQPISLTVTTISQNTNATSNGTTTNVPPPVVSTHTTADFLARLAMDEQLLANWPSNSFPVGARLAVVPNSGNPFLGVVLGTNLLVDVSDIINFDSDDIQVISGSQNIGTGLATPSTKTIHLGSISFDDRGIGNPNGSLHFNLQGIFTETTIDTAPKNGFFTHTHIVKMTAGSGDGKLGSNPFVCTGTVSSTGSAVLPAVF